MRECVRTLARYPGGLLESLGPRLLLSAGAASPRTSTALGAMRLTWPPSLIRCRKPSTTRFRTRKSAGPRSPWRVCRRPWRAKIGQRELQPIRHEHRAGHALQAALGLIRQADRVFRVRPQTAAARRFRPRHPCGGTRTQPTRPLRHRRTARPPSARGSP